jgi:hypothetical protein
VTKRVDSGQSRGGVDCAGKVVGRQRAALDPGDEGSEPETRALAIKCSVVHVRLREINQPILAVGRSRSSRKRCDSGHRTRNPHKRHPHHPQRELQRVPDITMSGIASMTAVWGLASLRSVRRSPIGSAHHGEPDRSPSPSKQRPPADVSGFPIRIGPITLQCRISTLQYGRSPSPHVCAVQ